MHGYLQAAPVSVKFVRAARVSVAVRVAFSSGLSPADPNPKRRGRRESPAASDKGRGVIDLVEARLLAESKRDV